jgi:hypothetical protein
MDLREYTYITLRPDTFPKSTLISIYKVLSKIQSSNVVLIDRILTEGYINPPSTYKWHGCYRIILSREEIMAISSDLLRAQNIFDKNSFISDEERHSLKQYTSFWARILSDSPESYDEYKSKQTYYDLNHISFKTFLDFIFEHEVANKAKNEDPWYFSNNIWIEYELTCPQ